jgi:subtilisin-like proprotein convertase family protein
MKRSALRTMPLACGLALVALVALVAAASAEELTNVQVEDIAIPASGNATPYPSELLVHEADGNILDLNVDVTLSHTWPDDVDIAVVSPEGDSEVLMSDACGNTDVSFELFEFDDATPSALPDAGPCSGGLFKPTNVGADDDFGAPGPGTISSAVLANFNGENPNGLWKLYVVDDSASDEGLIGNWRLTITTATAEIVVPGILTSGPASPYPSTKMFDTPPGQVVSDVNFLASDFNHMHPDDVDMLLAGPRRGATTILMSDACGADDIQHYFWSFDDEALGPMTDEEISGCNPPSIKPSDFGSIESLPAPAPAPPHGLALSAFDGLEGGQWSLFVNDDGVFNTGFLTSWTLNVATRDAADTGFSAPSATASEGATALLEVKRSGPAPAALGPASLVVTTSLGSASADDLSVPPATLEFARGQVSKAIAIPIAADKAAEGAEAAAITLSEPRDDARLTGTKTATLVINPSAAVVDPPADNPATLPLKAPISNRFTFGKLKRNAKKGTATLYVNVPGPGQLALSGKKVKAAKKAAAKAGPVALPIKAKGKALGVLADAGSVKFGVKVTFTPSGGSPLTLPKRVKLLLGD